MAWKVRRVVNEEGLTILGPYKTQHGAMWGAEKDARKLKRLGYDLVWYDIEEINAANDDSR